MAEESLEVSEESLEVSAARPRAIVLGAGAQGRAVVLPELRL